MMGGPKLAFTVMYALPFLLFPCACENPSASRYFYREGGFLPVIVE
jgi:hypothetical protein